MLELIGVAVLLILLFVFAIAVLLVSWSNDKPSKFTKDELFPSNEGLTAICDIGEQKVYVATGLVNNGTPQHQQLSETVMVAPGSDKVGCSYKADGTFDLKSGTFNSTSFNNRDVTGSDVGDACGKMLQACQSDRRWIKTYVGGATCFV